MLGLKKFDGVQTFQRRPFVPSHNFCHSNAIFGKSQFKMNRLTWKHLLCLHIMRLEPDTSHDIWSLDFLPLATWLQSRDTLVSPSVTPQTQIWRDRFPAWLQKSDSKSLTRSGGTFDWFLCVCFFLDKSLIWNSDLPTCFITIVQCLSMWFVKRERIGILSLFSGCYNRCLKTTILSQLW